MMNYFDLKYGSLGPESLGAASNCDQYGGLAMLAGRQNSRYRCKSVADAPQFYHTVCLPMEIS